MQPSVADIGEGSGGPRPNLNVLGNVLGPHLVNRSGSDTDHDSLCCCISVMLEAAIVWSITWFAIGVFVYVRVMIPWRESIDLYYVK